MNLITNLKNIEYLTGFTGSHAFLLTSKKENYFFTDQRYLDRVKNIPKSHTRINFKVLATDQNTDKKIARIVKNNKLFFEEDHMSVKDIKELKKRLSGIKLEPIKKEDTIEQIRAIKTLDEIKKIKKSQQINEKTLDCIKKLLKPGVKETEIAWKIRQIAHDFGIDELSFDPIVAFGKNSAIPHHKNTHSRLKKSDIVLIDMGMNFKGYASDMTRTFLPKNPSIKQINVYDAVLRAQTKAMEAIKNGITANEIDIIARKEMGKYQKYFTHSLGHGLGLDIHETPRLGETSTDLLKTGMVITVEPGIYLKGEFGVRIEDMGIVTKNGFTVFTRFKK